MHGCSPSKAADTSRSLPSTERDRHRQPGQFEGLLPTVSLTLQRAAEHLAVGEVVVARALKPFEHGDIAGVAVAADLGFTAGGEDVCSSGDNGCGVAVATARGRDADQADHGAARI